MWKKWDDSTAIKSYSYSCAPKIFDKSVENYKSSLAFYLLFISNFIWNILTKFLLNSLSTNTVRVTLSLAIRTSCYYFAQHCEYVSKCGHITEGAPTFEYFICNNRNAFLMPYIAKCECQYGQLESIIILALLLSS